MDMKTKQHLTNLLEAKIIERAKANSRILRWRAKPGDVIYVKKLKVEINLLRQILEL